MIDESCVHCGLCLSSCPTYLVTGVETESPRGRVWLLSQYSSGVDIGHTGLKHLDDCLDCRACEEACPAHIPVGHMVNQFRIASSTGVARSMVKPLRYFFATRRGRRRFKRLLNWSRYRVVKRTMSWFPGWIPPDALALASGLPPQTAATARPVMDPVKEGRVVMLFKGCVMDTVYGKTNQRAHDLLHIAGARVVNPELQTCCGALLYHSGDTEILRDLVLENLAAFEESGSQDVAVTAGGCSAFMKEYRHLFSPEDPVYDRVARFAEAVKDVSDVLVQLGLPLLPSNGQRISMHDACHLAHAQGIRQSPRTLLRGAGYELVEMPDSDRCCGAAGTYNLTHPEMSRTLLAYKISDIPQDIDAVALGNPGCQLQIAAGLNKQGRRVPVQHTVDLLWDAYQGGNDGRV